MEFEFVILLQPPLLRLVHKNKKYLGILSKWNKLSTRIAQSRLEKRRGRISETKPRGAAFLGEEIVCWNLSFRRLLRQAFFFSFLCWDHLRSEEGEETFFEILPFDLPKGAFDG